jgi:hypothetical protein
MATLVMYVITHLNKMKEYFSEEQGDMRCCISLPSFLNAFAKLRKATISFVMSVRPCIRPRETMAPTIQILMKLDIWAFFSKMC